MIGQHFPAYYITTQLDQKAKVPDTDNAIEQSSDSRLLTRLVNHIAVAHMLTFSRDSTDRVRSHYGVPKHERGYLDAHSQFDEIFPDDTFPSYERQSKQAVLYSPSEGLTDLLSLTCFMKLMQSLGDQHADGSRLTVVELMGRVLLGAAMLVGYSVRLGFLVVTLLPKLLESFSLFLDFCLVDLSKLLLTMNAQAWNRSSWSLAGAGFAVKSALLSACYLAVCLSWLVLKAAHMVMRQLFSPSQAASAWEEFAKLHGKGQNICFLIKLISYTASVALWIVLLPYVAAYALPWFSQHGFAWLVQGINHIYQFAQGPMNLYHLLSADVLHFEGVFVLISDFLARHVQLISADFNFDFTVSVIAAKLRFEFAYALVFTFESLVSLITKLPQNLSVFEKVSISFFCLVTVLPAFTFGVQSILKSTSFGGFLKSAAIVLIVPALMIGLMSIWSALKSHQVKVSLSDLKQPLLAGEKEPSLVSSEEKNLPTAEQKAAAEALNAANRVTEGVERDVAINTERAEKTQAGLLAAQGSFSASSPTNSSKKVTPVPADTGKTDLPVVESDTVLSTTTPKKQS